MLTTCLNNIRKPGQSYHTAAFAVLSLLGGVALGLFAKWLDNLALGSGIWWHRLLERLDLNNFFSELAVWLLLALVLAVFSPSAVHAAGNVFLFFAGMCAAYHAYTVLFCGFNPSSYMLLWYGITLLSPLLAALCWYARGEGAAALVLDAGVIAVFIRCCFSVGLFYVDVRGILYLLVFLGALAALYRSPRQLFVTLPAGFLLALLLSPLWQF